MKKKNFKYPKAYLYAAVGGAIAIVALVGYYLLSPLLLSDETKCIYIDNDTIDSVFAKIDPFASNSGRKLFTP